MMFTRTIHGITRAYTHILGKNHSRRSGKYAVLWCQNQYCVVAAGGRSQREIEKEGGVLIKVYERRRVQLDELIRDLHKNYCEVPL